MILDEQDRDAFVEYEIPLRFLEYAFNSAGLLIQFRLAVAHGEKVVAVENKSTNRIRNTLSIECDSPAQAVKDVAAGVKL